MSNSCDDRRTGDMLHAYELGMLSEDEKDKFEAHLLECEFCFAHLKEFAPRGSMLAVSLEIKRLLEASVEREAQAKPRWWEALWPEPLPAILRPAVLLGVLVLMLYPAYLGIFNRPSGEIVSAQEIGLVQTRSRQTYLVERDRTVVLSFICPEGSADGVFSIVLRGPSGEIVYRDDGFRGVDEYRVGRLLLPERAVVGGEYSLRVGSVGGEPDDLSLLEYVFEIEFGSSER